MGSESHGSSQVTGERKVIDYKGGMRRREVTPEGNPVQLNAADFGVDAV